MTVVVFGAEKGGVGKSSNALNFAVIASQSGVDTVLLDTDKLKTSSNWLALRSQDESLSRLSILSNSVDPLGEIASLSARYELVVVDIGAQSYKALVECALLADIYIVPTSTSGLDLDSAEELFALFRKLRPKKGQEVNAYALLAKVPPSSNSKEVERTRERLAEFDIPVLQTVMPHRAVWRSMANTGRAIHELTGRYGDQKATSEVKALYDEVVKLLTRKKKAKA